MSRLEIDLFEGIVSTDFSVYVKVCENFDCFIVGGTLYKDD